MINKSCAIIGAGLGGLAVSIRLAMKGYRVKVFEKNAAPGGKASQIITGKFRFDSGPSLLTMPFVLQELFSAAGENIQDYLQLQKLDIICKYFFSDGTILNAYSNQDDFINEAVRKTKENKENLEKFFSYSKKIYDLTAELFLFNPLLDSKNLFNTKSFKTLLQLNKIDTMRSMHEAINSFLIDDKMIQLFDRYATYNGSNPFTAPATLNLISHVENGLGAYISRTGIYSITESLYKLAVKLGVQFNFSKSVSRILVSEGRVNGIEVDSEKFSYDFLISNCDVNFTYQNLLNDKTSFCSKIYNRIEPSSSAFVFYWGVQGIHNQLEVHNILFSENYKQEFEDLFKLHQIPNDPTIYIYISSKFNPNDATIGYENWFVMINAPFNNHKTELDISELKQKIILKIKLLLNIDLKDKIITEEILTPAAIEIKTNSHKGSIYGISSNSKFSAFMRQPNRSLKYRGLYFVGGSAHPGGGIPLVILSGMITSELISKFEK
jgi:phytoene desaturase